MCLYEKPWVKGGESRRSPGIEDSGQEGSYISDREDTRHPEEDRHARMAQQS